MARVLIADDVAPRNAETAKLLKSAGHAVTVVTDGREARACLETESPDLLITKLMLPFVDGYLLAARLREARSGGLVLMIAPLGADGEPMRHEETGLVDGDLVGLLEAAEVIGLAMRLLGAVRRTPQP
jgi:DNA-binding response OmpR family regulator